MDSRSVSCDNVKSNLRYVQSRYRLYCGIGCDSGVAVRVEAEDATVIYIYAGEEGRQRVGYATSPLPGTYTKLFNDPPVVVVKN